MGTSIPDREQEPASETKTQDNSPGGKGMQGVKNSPLTRGSRIQILRHFSADWYGGLVSAATEVSYTVVWCE